MESPGEGTFERNLLLNRSIAVKSFLKPSGIVSMGRFEIEIIRPVQR